MINMLVLELRRVASPPGSRRATGTQTGLAPIPKRAVGKQGTGSRAGRRPGAGWPAAGAERYAGRQDPGEAAMPRRRSVLRVHGFLRRVGPVTARLCRHWMKMGETLEIARGSAGPENCSN